ncbi:aminoglycoside adenylyltransferase domain-containing protein [Exiguobacterium algae]|uniref:aminoglycoside adenylyltransferase domain-containing protein n=1 Tax=Exiguobacterium algae TaxID=2751250 RepID=UPI001BE7536E|nr:aminoglycoside adenylyltransferase domain-containing protein [Exiguobacterium algae]
MKQVWIPRDVGHVIRSFLTEVEKAVPHLRHVYVHGSLAMGGFQPDRSDLDLLLVTSRSLDQTEKEAVLNLCLKWSASPYPLELSILSQDQLQNWCHPSPFEFHFSEGWRERFERAEAAMKATLQTGVRDPDLAAHVKVIMERGIVWKGEAIEHILSGYEESHFEDAIHRDVMDCFDSVQFDPVYALLNMVRAFAYKKEQYLLSKQEAYSWLRTRNDFPGNIEATVRKASLVYSGEAHSFSKEELDEAVAFFWDQFKK